MCLRVLRPGDNPAVINKRFPSMEEVAPSNGRRYGLHTAGRARGEEGLLRQTHSLVIDSGTASEPENYVSLSLSLSLM